MPTWKKSIAHILCIFLFIIAETSGKGGRAGGGFKGSGGRGTGRSNAKPNLGGYKPMNNPNVYRSQFSASRGGVRWSSFGAGMLAYGLMSNIASRGHYHPGYYSGYHRSRDNYGESHVGTGSTCVNNEDFNGTKFGEFACPLPGFKSSASYCCGSLETETQYCCEFFDDDTRKISVILAILAIGGLIICIIACVFRVAKRNTDSNKYGPSRTFVSHPPNIINMNRNIGPRPPPGGPGPNRPPMNGPAGPAGMYPRQQQAPPQQNRQMPMPNTQPEGFPLLAQSSNGPNMAGSAPPPPGFIFNDRPYEQPPSYTDAVK